MPGETNPEIDQDSEEYRAWVGDEDPELTADMHARASKLAQEIKRQPRTVGEEELSAELRRQAHEQHEARDDLARKLKRTFDTPIHVYGEMAQDELFGIPTDVLLSVLRSGVAGFQPGWRSIVFHELRRRGIEPSADLATDSTQRRRGLSREEPPPIPNEGKAIQELVAADILQRMQHGIEKYGTPVQAFNGRVPLIDAYQEAMDLVIYLRQAIEEQGLGYRLEEES